MKIKFSIYLIAIGDVAVSVQFICDITGERPFMKYTYLEKNCYSYNVSHKLEHPMHDMPLYTFKV